jgi:hypothetical protein
VFKGLHIFRMVIQVIFGVTMISDKFRGQRSLVGLLNPYHNDIKGLVNEMEEKNNLKVV